MSEQNQNTDNDDGELTKDNYSVNATFTNTDGETVTTTDFTVEQIDVKKPPDEISEVSSGLSPAIEDAKNEFQLTVEVPTKTLVCPNCDKANNVPAWSFVNMQFSGDMEPLSGDYALGHQCSQCGFPY